MSLGSGGRAKSLGSWGGTISVGIRGGATSVNIEQGAMSVGSEAGAISLGIRGGATSVDIEQGAMYLGRWGRVKFLRSWGGAISVGMGGGGGKGVERVMLPGNRSGFGERGSGVGIGTATSSRRSVVGVRHNGVLNRLFSSADISQTLSDRSTRKKQQSIDRQILLLTSYMLHKVCTLDALLGHK